MASEEEIISLAISAGLGRATELCRDDVLAAARSAETFRAGLGELPGPRSEPWPAMRVKGPS